MGNNGIGVVGVLSTGGPGASGAAGYTFPVGTSMAAPHVAGVISPMKSVNPGLGPADIDARLIRGDLSDDLGASGRDNEYGYGLINAQRAVLAALEAGGSAPANNPVLSASAGTLNFSSAIENLQLELRNGGKGRLELLSVSASEPWLELSPLEVGSDGLGLYRVAVDRGDLAAGVYSTDVIARSSINTLTIRVIMSVGGSATADVGVVYILLYEQGTEEAVAQASAVASGGSYKLEFRDVPRGQYQIFAGSDADNDLLICDAGEACGSWLTVDQPIIIDLECDREKIDFPVDYLIAIPSIAADGQATRSGTNQAEPRARLKSARGLFGKK